MSTKTKAPAQTKPMPNASTAPSPAIEAASPVTMPLDVRIHDICLTGAMRATASATIGGCFAVRGLRVMQGTNGLFVNFPSRQLPTGKYWDICFPTTKEFRQMFEHDVIQAYKQALAQAASQQQDGSQHTGNECPFVEGEPQTQTM